MKEKVADFMAKSTIKAADKEHRRKILFNIGKYNAAVPLGKKQFTDVGLVREKAKNLKWKAIETLDKQLETFEAVITRRGAKVIWAEDAQQALEAVKKICEEKNCKILVKSKSMVTEEIHLNHFLEKNGIESVETDLGEYIQQLDGEPPYHIVTPAMHKSKEDVAKLFAEKLGTDPKATPEQLTLTARRISVSYTHLLENIAYIFLAVTTVSIPFLAIILLVLLLLAFTISGAEVALFSLNKKDINMLKTKEHSAAKRIVDLLDEPKEVYASLLIAGTFVNISIIVLSNFLINQFISFQKIGFVTELLTKVLVIAFVLVFFGKVLPLSLIHI